MQHEILIVSSRNVATLTIHQDFLSFCCAIKRDPACVRAMDMYRRRASNTPRDLTDLQGYMGIFLLSYTHSPILSA